MSSKPTLLECRNGIHVFEMPNGGYAACRCNCEGRRQDPLQRGLREITNTWGAFELNAFHPEEGTREAHLCAQLVVENVLSGQPSHGLFLFGPTGVGKTHLGIGVVRAVLAAGIPAWALDCSELAHLFSTAAGHSNQGEGAEEKLRRLAHQKVLCVDDMTWAKRASDAGKKEVVSTFENGMTLFLRDFRGALILTSNVGRGLQDALGERLWSRIAERCEPRKLVGEDYRLKRRP